MARRQHHNSISLFPFLAVLVCAMGALILLLLVMTRKIRHDQQLLAATVDAEIVAASVDRSDDIRALQIQVDTAEQNVDHLKAELARQQQAVTDQRSQLVAAQKELTQLQAHVSSPHEDSSNVAELLRDIRSLKSEEAALLEKLTEAEKRLFDKQQLLARAEDDAANARLKLRQQHSALVSLRAQVQQATEKAAATDGTSTLLEFSNSTGTTRTPIVIDVTSKGFELLPEEVLIGPEDMEGFPVRDNPLLSVILTAHRHRSRGSVTSEPYVLLVVRPDGALPFYHAQRILIDAKVHYGFELVEQDEELKTGDRDPAALPLIQSALTEAFQRREKLYAKLMAIMEQHRSEQSGGGGSASGQPGPRRMSVRPDGRVVEESDRSAGILPGQFYAGGVAPPTSHYRNRANALTQSGDTDRLTPAEASHLAEQFAAQYAKQQEAARLAQARPAETGSVVPTEITPPNPSRHLAANSSGSQDESGSAAGFRSMAEQRFADTLFGGDGSMQSARVADANAAVASSAGSGPAEAAGETANLSSTGTSRSGQPSTVIDEWLAAGSKEQSGTTGGSGVPGDADPNASPGMMPDLSRVDPDLLRQFPSPKKQSSSLSTPIGITVFLDAHHMTIGQQQTMPMNSDSLNEAFARLLTGINTEVEDVRRGPEEPVMPIVKFVVSPGGEKWRIPLAQGLRSTGIHSAEVLELTPYITTADETGRAALEQESQQ
jgi:hypothetical protein